MRLFISFLICIVFLSCNSEVKETTNPFQLKGGNTTTSMTFENLISGKTYLSVYSDIYDLNEETTHLLTATISIRNTCEKEKLFITRADYYNTKGELVRKYIENPVYLSPLETAEIIIPRRDSSGGSGAKFIFEWAIPDEKYEPLIESVMIWTTGNQGVSFTSRGINFSD